MHRFFFTAIIAVCVSASVFAQEPVITGSDSLRHIRQVDIHGEKTQSNVAASKPVQQMSKEEIDLLGIHELADAVKKFAGTNVRDYGGIGGMKTVSVRNLGAHHTAVSYDGMTISNTQAGQIDIGRFSLDNVERIGLAIGNEEGLMQTARHYASAGLLSITTENPHFDHGHKWSFRGGLRAGSFGLVSPSLRYWQQLSSSTVLSLNGTYMHADGAYPFTLVNGKNRTHEKRHNSDIDSWQGEANIYHTFRDGGQLDTKAYWYYSERRLPGSVILYNTTARERLWDEDFFAQTIYTKSFSPEWKLSGKLKYTHSWNLYEDYGPNYSSGKLRDVNRQNEYYGSATLGWLPTSNFKMSLAQDLFFNDLRNNIRVSANEGPSNPVRTTSLTALNAQWDLQRLQLDGNMVYAFAHEHVVHGSQPSDRSRLSPTLSASYSLLRNGALRIRAMVKNTFRMPTFNDLYYRRMGNTGLRPEKARLYNVGLTWSGRPFGFTRYMNITVDGYHNDVTDKIVAFPSTYVWKMANFGKVAIDGIDATLSAEVGLFKKVDLVVNAAYSYQKSVDKLKQSSSYNKQLPYTPRHSGNASVLIKNPWVNIGYSLLMQGERWSIVIDSDQYRLDPFWEHTLTLSHRFQFRTWSMELRGTVRNLFDEQYEIIKYYPMPGRSGEVTLNFEL